MSWRPIDFQGIVSLDRSLVEHIDHYLEEKESRLANQIVQSIPSLPKEPHKPSLSRVQRHFKLSDAVDLFTREIRQTDFQHIDKKGEEVIQELNKTFWEFTEVLEGFVVELFQQIKQVRIDQWGLAFADVIKAIKDTLVHHLDEVIWTIQRLEKPLLEFRQKQGHRPSWWELFHRKSQLDPLLLTNLTQTETFLKEQYNDFHNQFEEFIGLSIQVEEYLVKMEKYPVLALMDMQDQNLYVDIFRLLKLYELNVNRKNLLGKEIIKSLKYISSINTVVKIFKRYYLGLKDAFFLTSFELKSISESSEVEKIKDKLKEYIIEINHLLGTMSKYRDVILISDPNPYVRSRWGFAEWTVAPEPTKAKMLLNQIYRVEELKRWYDSFLKDLDDPLDYQIYPIPEIERLLHEMGQPLISKHMIKNRAQNLLEEIRDCHEVSSPEFETINYLGQVFARAMRADWKYHVLHEYSLFHELFRIHQGFEGPLEDPAHAFRLDRFKELLREIDKWVKKGEIFAHINEIELDISDMKAYLQDFLASIQRSVKEKASDPFWDDTVKKFRMQLLEYRHLFGRFFYQMMQENVESQQLRNQFLFVDQYFETVEDLLT